MQGPGVPSNSDATSPTLLERLREQEESAWDTLKHVYGPLIEQWCRKPGLQKADVDDVCQEVFAAVQQKIGDFRKRAGGSFRGWLWTITWSKINDRFRKDRIRAAGGSDAAEVLKALPAPADSTGSVDEWRLTIQRALEVVLRKYAEKTREAFRRVVLNDELIADVARDLGMKKGAIYTAKSRILSHLRREFAEVLDLEVLDGERK